MQNPLFPLLSVFYLASVLIIMTTFWGPLKKKLNWKNVYFLLDFYYIMVTISILDNHENIAN